MSYFFFNISAFTLKEWNAMQHVCFSKQKIKIMLLIHITALITQNFFNPYFLF